MTDNFYEPAGTRKLTREHATSQYRSMIGVTIEHRRAPEAVTPAGNPSRAKSPGQPLAFDPYSRDTRTVEFTGLNNQFGRLSP